MANRRMFSKEVIETDAFLSLSIPAQALYFHLGMTADDEGFTASVTKTIRMVGFEDDKPLHELIDAGFVIRFDSGIAAIVHWKINNQIQKDRFKATVYAEEKAMLIETADKKYHVSDMDTSCIQNVPLDEYRRDEVSKDEYRRDEGNANGTDTSESRLTSDELLKIAKKENIPATMDDMKEFREWCEAHGWEMGGKPIQKMPAAIWTFLKNRDSFKAKNAPAKKPYEIENRKRSKEEWEEIHMHILYPVGKRSLSPFIHVLILFDKLQKAVGIVRNSFTENLFVCPFRL